MEKPKIVSEVYQVPLLRERSAGGFFFWSITPKLTDAFISNILHDDEVLESRNNIVSIF